MLGANLHMPHRIVEIKPSRNLLEHTSACHPGSSKQKPSRHRPEQTSACHPTSSIYNLYEIARSKPPHATPHRLYKNLHDVVRSKTPHATSDRPDKTFMKASGSNLHMPARIVHIRPLRNLSERTSTCYTASSRLPQQSILIVKCSDL